MSIKLITGLPGSGKSLRTVQAIEAFLKEGRPVFAKNVYGLNLPGVMELDDPNQWEALPHGAVIVIDEAHKVWPSSRAEPIPPVVALREHRHHGKDFVLVTQFPAFLNVNVRRLAQPHEHLVRKFGMEASTIYAWNEGQTDVESPSVRELAEESLWLFPKHLYGKYESATIHTVKRRVPKAFYAIAAAALLIPALAYSAYTTITGWTDDAEEQAQEPEQADGLSLLSPSADTGPDAGPQGPDPNLTKWIPRVPHVAWSAPAYDGFEVQDYPRPHCVIVGDQRIERITCRCYTQQVTPMEMPDTMCISIARYGTWDPRRAAFQQREESEQRTVSENDQGGIDRAPVGIGGFDRAVHLPFTTPDRMPDAVLDTANIN